MSSAENPEVGRENLLDRETPFTVEEIAAMRSKEIKDSFGSLRKYNAPGVEVIVGQNPLLDYKIRGEEHLRHIKSVGGLREKGEAHVFEWLLVNALFEQARIAKKFGLPERSVNLSMKLDFSERGSMMMDNWGNIYILALSEHIESLKKKGANDNQIITEVSGHIFHEAIHMATDHADTEEGLDTALLGGRGSIGEITSITGQLSYYLEKGYTGPKTFDTHWALEGRKKISGGEDDVFDYDIATAITQDLILEQLKSVFPDIFKEGKAVTCEEVISKIPPERKYVLISALKEAILQSANPEKIEAVIGNYKTKS